MMDLYAITKQSNARDYRRYRSGYHRLKLVFYIIAFIAILPACKVLEDVKSTEEDNSDPSGETITELIPSIVATDISAHEDGAIISYAAKVDGLDEFRRRSEVERNIYSLFFPAMGTPREDHLIATSTGPDTSINLVSTAMAERYHWVLLDKGEGIFELAREDGHRDIEWPYPDEVYLAEAQNELQQAQTREERAQEQLDTIISQQAEAQQSLESLQTTYGELEDIVISLEQELQDIEASITAAEDLVDIATNAFTQAEADLMDALQAHGDAMTAEGEAHDALVDAQENGDESDIAMAQAALDAAEQNTIQAQQALDDAQAQFDQAEQDKIQAEGELYVALNAQEDTQEALDDAQQELQEAADELSALQEVLDDFESSREDAEQELAAATEAFDTASQNLEEATIAHQKAASERDQNDAEQNDEELTVFAVENLLQEENEVQLLTGNGESYQDEGEYEIVHAEGKLVQRREGILDLAILKYEIKRLGSRNEVEARVAADIYTLVAREHGIDHAPPKTSMTRYILYVEETSLNEAIDNTRFSNMNLLFASFNDRFALAYTEIDGDDIYTKILSNVGENLEIGQVFGADISGTPITLWLNNNNVQVITATQAREIFWGYSQSGTLYGQQITASLPDTVKSGMRFDIAGNLVWMQEDAGSVEVNPVWELTATEVPGGNFDLGGNIGSGARNCFDICIALYDNLVHGVWVEQDERSNRLPAMRYIVLEDDNTLRRETVKNGQFNLNQSSENRR